MAGDNVCSVVIGGKRRELVYGTRAICFIEEATGKSFADAAGQGGISFLVVAVAAGLQHLPEQRKKLKDKDGAIDLTLIEGWFDAMPKANEPDGDDAPDTLKSLGKKVAVAMRGGMPGVRIADDEGKTPGEAPAAG